jgi:hypothetical protein
MILNRASDGLATVLVALRRAVAAYGPQSEDRLLDLCAPTTVVGDKQDMARKTLTRWTQLGMFIVDAGTVSLDTATAALPADDIEGFRRAALRLVLRADNNPGITTNSADGDEVHQGKLASDFTRAASWLLAQDPYAFEPIWEVERDVERGVSRLVSSQNVKPSPFTNNTRWDGFADWATFLGIGRRAARIGFVINPAFAVHGVLDEVFGGLEEMGQEPFLQRLGDALPVVDGGVYRAAVESTIGRPWRIITNREVSPALSAALLHLEAAGVVRIETRSDAPQRMLLGRGARELRAFSHVMHQQRGPR